MSARCIKVPLVPLVLLTGGLAALLQLPPASAKNTTGRNAAIDVSDRIAAKDCAGAVDRLNDGLKRELAEVALLAGSMFEQGLCVQRDWKRAVSFYARAYEGNLPEAASRLAAGFAAPENGPDIAAALWWASRGKGSAALMPATAGCAVDTAAAADPELFVAELKTWTQARLQTCNYIAGVMGTLSAEVRYPKLAKRWVMGGDVALRFLPAVPQIDMREGAAREYMLVGAVNGNQAQNHKIDQVRDSFETAIGEVAGRALRRYPQPAGIPADTMVLVVYRFILE